MWSEPHLEQSYWAFINYLRIGTTILFVVVVGVFVLGFVRNWRKK